MNPATPVRQIPGAFINTPGPNTVRRRLNFNEAAGVGTTSTTVAAPGPIASTMGAGQQEIVTGMLPAPQARDDLPPVVKASQVINQTLQLDESYPDIDSYCRRKLSFIPPRQPYQSADKSNKSRVKQLAHPPTTIFSMPIPRGPRFKRRQRILSPIRYFPV